MKKLLALFLLACSAFAQLPKPSGGTGRGGSSSGTTYPVGYNFDGGGSALSTGTRYVQVPFGCTIVAWNIIVDTGTATVKVWRKATGGTALPTNSDSINTSGVSISSNNVIRSTTLTDFTSLQLAAGDVLGINLSAVSSATTVHFNMECAQ